jgi:hypothetical protein
MKPFNIMFNLTGNKKIIRETRRVIFKVLIIYIDLYIRKIQQSNEKVIALREKFPLERIEAYVDSWPCLSLRKCIMRFRV